VGFGEYMFRWFLGAEGKEDREKGEGMSKVRYIIPFDICGLRVSYP